LRQFLPHSGGDFILTMPIFKIHPSKKEYVTVSNKTLRDPRLSFKAKGILAYLLSYSENWRPQVLDIVNHGTEGKSAVWSAFRELRALGYMEMVHFRSKNGKQLIGRGWHVYEDAKPVTQEISVTDNRDSTKAITIQETK